MTQPGAIVARALHGAWRSSTPDHRRSHRRLYLLRRAVHRVAVWHQRPSRQFALGELALRRARRRSCNSQRSQARRALFTGAPRRTQPRSGGAFPTMQALLGIIAEARRAAPGDLASSAALAFCWSRRGWLGAAALSEMPTAPVGARCPDRQSPGRRQPRPRRPCWPGCPTPKTSGCASTTTSKSTSKEWQQARRDACDATFEKRKSAARAPSTRDRLS